MGLRSSGEKILEAILFGSRWILAPVYIGLVISLLMLLTAFVTEILHALPHLIDLSLALNLVLIVVFSGYENFVSKIDTGDSEDRPQWMGTLDFSGMKMKLIGSIVAISAISLLRAFMAISASDTPFDKERMYWMIVLHLTFIVSGVLFAVMDWISALTDAGKEREKNHTAEHSRTR